MDAHVAALFRPPAKGSPPEQLAHVDLAVGQPPVQSPLSIVSMTSLRDLETRIGAALDPLDFQADIYVEGWPAWAENGWADRELMIGFARVRVVGPIARDGDIAKALSDNYSHDVCGVLVHVTDGGRVTAGDACTIPRETAA